jgi:hypothetical protein
MTWTLRKKDGVTPQNVYDLAKDHRLDWEALPDFIDVCKATASMCDWYDIMADDVYAGTILITGVVDEVSATIELIPVPAFFVGDYAGKVKDAILPILDDLFIAHDVRRVTSMVPYSRFRTRKALIACGFVREGAMRQGVQFRRRDPEDLLILGMTVEDHKKVHNGTR